MRYTEIAKRVTANNYVRLTAATQEAARMLRETFQASHAVLLQRADLWRRFPLQIQVDFHRRNS